MPPVGTCLWQTAISTTVSLCDSGQLTQLLCTYNGNTFQTTASILFVIFPTLLAFAYQVPWKLNVLSTAVSTALFFVFTFSRLGQSLSLLTLLISAILGTLFVAWNFERHEKESFVTSCSLEKRCSRASHTAEALLRLLNEAEVPMVVTDHRYGACVGLSSPLTLCGRFVPPALFC